MLAIVPVAASALRQTAPDTVSFPILQLLTDLGIDTMPDSPHRRMLELEALQLSQNTDIESIMPADPAAASPEGSASGYRADLLHRLRPPRSRDHSARP